LIPDIPIDNQQPTDSDVRINSNKSKICGLTRNGNYAVGISAIRISDQASTNLKIRVDFFGHNGNYWSYTKDNNDKTIIIHKPNESTATPPSKSLGKEFEEIIESSQ
jgi:hypothetical protein